jgi:cytochrome oxidase Cu insertion factor (SCO1/SenC/PrrC family)
MRPRGAFRLIDHHRVEVTDESYRGKYVLVFFGFTHCKVVCPRALGKLTNVLEALGPLAERLTALYVTVDPERDTPDVMRTFLERRYPRFTGLTGSRERIDEAKKAFRVFARRSVDPDDPDGYAVPHTAITYVLDPSGQYAAHFTAAAGEAEITARLRSLLS